MLLNFYKGQLRTRHTQLSLLSLLLLLLFPHTHIWHICLCIYRRNIFQNRVIFSVYPSPFTQNIHHILLSLSHTKQPIFSSTQQQQRKILWYWTLTDYFPYLCIPSFCFNLLFLNNLLHTSKKLHFFINFFLRLVYLRCALHTFS